MRQHLLLSACPPLAVLNHYPGAIAIVSQAISALGPILAYMAQWASYGVATNRDDNRGPNPIGLLLAVFVAPLAAPLIQMTISRTREFEADAGSGRLTKNPRALANALQKLEASARQTPIQENPAFEPMLNADY